MKDLVGKSTRTLETNEKVLICQQRLSAAIYKTRLSMLLNDWIVARASAANDEMERLADDEIKSILEEIEKL